MTNISLNEARQRLIFALDVPDVCSAEQLLDRLDGKVGVVKVGLELFAKAGPAAVEAVQRRGYKLFLDLKLHDIPNTVAGAVRSASSLGVSMLTVHTGGGRKMLEAAVDAADPALTLLGVTLLTSMAPADLTDTCISGTPESVVLRRAELARATGLGGIVCSPKEVSSVKAQIGTKMVAVTPGIRPAGAEMGDQKRAATPGTAIAGGADFLVVGRPIGEADSPAAAADTIVREMAAAMERR
jgi:orotidine-5'-phosphate decarboxylase